jgi:hypothetical protein
MIINVETEKSWRVLHYCTSGAINMDKPSVASVRSYASEAGDLGRNFCYFLDVWANIFLWRGRARTSIFGYSVTTWFPIHSIWLFVSCVVAYEKPPFAPAIFFFGLAWIMISTNMHISRHPYPWYRVKKFESLLWGIVTRTRAFSSTHSVEANTLAKEKAAYDALDTIKAERMMALINAFISTGLKAYGIYSGTNITSIVDTTEDNSVYFLSGTLYYPHLLLKCKFASFLVNSFPVPCTSVAPV